MERRCCARVAPGVEPTIVFGTPPVAGSRTLQAFVFDLGSNLGSIHFFLSKLLLVVVSIYWQGPTGTRYPPATRPGSVQTQTQNIGYNRHFRSTQNIRSTLNTWHARRYSTCTEIPDSEKGTQKYPTQYFNTSTRPLPACYPTFFSKPDPYRPNIEKEKKLPVGSCLLEPASIALVVVLAPKS